MRDCHPPPYYTDNSMHNLQIERFFEPQMINGRMASADGPIKTFPLRGIKDSPPYLHDGRLLTLEDTVEFFNLVLGTKLTEAEKRGPASRSCWRSRRRYGGGRSDHHRLGPSALREKAIEARARSSRLESGRRSSAASSDARVRHCVAPPSSSGLPSPSGIDRRQPGHVDRGQEDLLGEDPRRDEERRAQQLAPPPAPRESPPLRAPLRPRGAHARIALVLGLEQPRDDLLAEQVGLARPARRHLVLPEVRRGPQVLRG